MIAERKSVSGINREFAQTTDQSCLNRFLTAVEWDVTELNERRLEWLQKSPDMRYSRQGVIAIDDVLIDHDGQFIKDVGWFWDHAEQRNKIAHDDLIANYVCTSGKHYPLELRHAFIHSAHGCARCESEPRIPPERDAVNRGRIKGRRHAVDARAKQEEPIVI